MNHLSPFGSAILETLLTLVPCEVENPDNDGGKASRRRIVFVVESDGNQGVYLVNGDGEVWRKLTTIGKDYIENPRETQITLHPGQNGSWELHFTQEDGTPQKKVINRSFGGQAEWIPDYILQMMGRIAGNSGKRFGGDMQFAAEHLI